MSSASEDDTPVAAPVVLSHGASTALNSAVSRLLKPERRDAAVRGKRPRGAVVLAENEEVQNIAEEERAARLRDREAKRARLRFEANARVVPDAATNAARERDLLATATRGAVALFNAVAKAQRAAKAASADRKKGKPVSKASFMSMIRAGVAEQEKEDDAEAEGEVGGNAAAWLKDDFVTAKARKLKDWDREAADGEGDTGSSDSNDDGSDDGSESGGESERDGGGEAKQKKGGSVKGGSDEGSDEDEGSDLE